MTGSNTGRPFKPLIPCVLIPTDRGLWTPFTHTKPLGDTRILLRKDKAGQSYLDLPVPFGNPPLTARLQVPLSSHDLRQVMLGRTPLQQAVLAATWVYLLPADLAQPSQYATMTHPANLLPDEDYPPLDILPPLDATLKETLSTFHAWEIITDPDQPPLPPDPQEARNKLLEYLKSALAHPIEDGMNHPAENVLLRAVGLMGEQAALQWLDSHWQSHPQTRLTATLLTCLGHLDFSGNPGWRAPFVRHALTSDDLEARDAAVTAVDQWGTPALVDLLREHQEPVAYLADYIAEIVAQHPSD